jgi:hypothetical protein
VLVSARGLGRAPGSSFTAQPLSRLRPRLPPRSRTGTGQNPGTGRASAAAREHHYARPDPPAALLSRSALPRRLLWAPMRRVGGRRRPARRGRPRWRCHSAQVRLPLVAGRRRRSGPRVFRRGPARSWWCHRRWVVHGRGRACTACTEDGVRRGLLGRLRSPPAAGFFGIPDSASQRKA